MAEISDKSALEDLKARFPQLSPANVRLCYITSYYDEPLAGLCLYRNRVHAFVALHDDTDGANPSVTTWKIQAWPSHWVRQTLNPALWWWLRDEMGRRYDSSPARPYWFEAFIDDTVAAEQTVGWVLR